MKVSFDTSVLDDPLKWDCLDRIVHFFWEERHFWQVDDPDAVEQSAWIASDVGSRAGRRNRETLEKMVTHNSYGETRRCIHTLLLVVTNTPANDLELSPSDAERCLRAPAYVLVENSTSDGAFLRAMISALDRVEMAIAIEEDWCRVEHLGGFGEVERRLREVLGRQPGPARVFVLVDSDSLYPGHRSETARKVESTCRSANVRHAILRKRRIENYLPDRLLHRANRRVYAAFAELKVVQREHYDMKHGFRVGAQGTAIVPPEQQQLYQHVRRHVLRDLCGGFGPEVWRWFQSEAATITQDDVRSVCALAPTEIDGILDAIESLI